MSSVGGNLSVKEKIIAEQHYHNMMMLERWNCEDQNLSAQKKLQIPNFIYLNENYPIIYCAKDKDYSNKNPPKFLVHKSELLPHKIIWNVFGEQNESSIKRETDIAIKVIKQNQSYKTKVNDCKKKVNSSSPREMPSPQLQEECMPRHTTPEVKQYNTTVIQQTKASTISQSSRTLNWEWRSEEDREGDDSNQDFTQEDHNRTPTFPENYASSSHHQNITADVAVTTPKTDHLKPEASIIHTPAAVDLTSGSIDHGFDLAPATPNITPRAVDFTLGACNVAHETAPDFIPGDVNHSSGAVDLTAETVNMTSGAVNQTPVQYSYPNSIPTDFTIAPNTFGNDQYFQYGNDTVNNTGGYNTTYVYENESNTPVNLSSASGNAFVDISPPTNSGNLAGNLTTNQNTGMLTGYNGADYTDFRHSNYTGNQNYCSGNRSVIRDTLNNPVGNFSGRNTGVQLRHRPVTLESRSSNDAAKYLPHEVSAQTDWTLPPREPFLFITTNQCELPEGGEDRVRLNSDTDTDLEHEAVPHEPQYYPPPKHSSQNIYFGHADLSDSFIDAAARQVLDTATDDQCKKAEANEDDEAMDEANFNLEAYIAGASTTTVRGQMLHETEVISTPKHTQLVEAVSVAHYPQRPRVGKVLPGVIDLTAGTASVNDEGVASLDTNDNLEEDNNKSIDDIYETLPEQSVEDGLRSVEDYEDITGLTPLDSHHKDFNDYSS